jgi:hypothetical protein
VFKLRPPHLSRVCRLVFFFFFCFLSRGATHLSFLTWTNYSITITHSVNARKHVIKLARKPHGLLQPLRPLLRGFLVSMYCSRTHDTPSQAQRKTRRILVLQSGLRYLMCPERLRRLGLGVGLPPSRARPTTHISV